jgi:hypothetical protein
MSREIRFCRVAYQNMAASMFLLKLNKLFFSKQFSSLVFKINYNSFQREMCKELEKFWLPFPSCQLHIIFAQLDSVIFILTTHGASLSDARCGALTLSRSYLSLIVTPICGHFSISNHRVEKKISFNLIYNL